MKKLVLTVFIGLFIAFTAQQAMAVTFSLSPSTQDITVGNSATLDLIVSGLTTGGPDSLGAFSLDITYDDTVLAFDSVTFGLYLGDPDWGEANPYFIDYGSSTVYLDEMSFLYDYELDAIQSDSFTLATIEFTGIGSGTSLIGMEYVVASDAFGFEFDDVGIETADINVSAPVPEPATMLLLGSGLAGLARFRRRFRKA